MASRRPDVAGAPAAAVAAAGALSAADWRDWLALLKPRVMSLAVFSAACGLLAAPVSLHPLLAAVAILAIAVGAGAAGAFNQWIEADTDSRMRRTAARPLAAGRLPADEALAFAVILAVGAVTTLALATNLVAAALLAAGIVYYALVYTVWLKPRTPQNIVIGGAAGAFPPVIGWAAATGDVTLMPVLLFLVIFLWTPPHFWALALFVAPDYAKAGIPMLPVTHGTAETRRQIWAYALALVAVSVAPWPLGLAGAVYGLTAAGLGAVFLLLAWRVRRSTITEPRAMAEEKALFRYSILYLFLLFGALVADARWLP
ncbi:heme o synthase [Thermaurantiacus tibetensis]|uniref:heme o synthase n=1 Tax=Thermaurantiacus tibetensis TaxID=2759035 RepID=UPI00188E8B42|nr:heme o synthase [Thermaurantiacus tibetensis]